MTGKREVSTNRLEAIAEHYFALCFKYNSFDDKTEPVAKFEKSGGRFIADIAEVSIEQELIAHWISNLAEWAENEVDEKSIVSPVSTQVREDANNARIAARLFLVNYGPDHEHYYTPELDVIAEAIREPLLFGEARELVAQGFIST